MTFYDWNVIYQLTLVCGVVFLFHRVGLVLLLVATAYALIAQIIVVSASYIVLELSHPISWALGTLAGFLVIHHWAKPMLQDAVK